MTAMPMIARCMEHQTPKVGWDPTLFWHFQAVRVEFDDHFFGPNLVVDCGRDPEHGGRLTRLALMLKSS